MRGLLISITVILAVVIVSLACLRDPDKPGISNKARMLVGKWKCPETEVVYCFYSDNTGYVEDSIEGDSILYWNIDEDNKLILVENPVYRDKSVYNISIQGYKFILEGGGQFRKINKN